jgi:hypothetical protein
MTKMIRLCMKPPDGTAALDGETDPVIPFKVVHQKPHPQVGMPQHQGFQGAGGMVRLHLIEKPGAVKKGTPETPLLKKKEGKPVGGEIIQMSDHVPVQVRFFHESLQHKNIQNPLLRQVFPVPAGAARGGPGRTKK